MKTLVIGDAHASPEHTNERFSALGNFIVSQQPDNIVQIGDWGSYDSVSAHNKGNLRVQEGMRLKDDVDAAQEAFSLAMTPTWKWNSKRANNRKKQYVFNGHWLEANHEFRVKRYVDENPVLEGFVPENDLVGASNYGWNVVPWKHCVYIHGVCFTHVPINDGNGQPISGKYVARRAAELHQSTVVFGHTHKFIVEPLARNNEDGALYVEGINVGWFGDYVPDYITGHMGTSHWWSGLVVLHHREQGQVDIERISMDTVKKIYG